MAHLRNHDEPLDNYLESRQDFIDGKVKGMPGASLGVAVRMQQAGLDYKDDSLLPTPRAQEPGSTSPGYGDGLNDVANRIVNGYAAKDLLPTVTTQDGKNSGGPSQFDRNTMPLNTQLLLIGTPRASAADSSSVQVAAGAPKGRIEDQVKLTDWGKFEPAIRRWEQVLDREAPAPTKPDGKEGAHRLSSKFTEWMMGLPDGWITDAGLSRNEELKACGNGVVPQQAEVALRLLLQGTQHDTALLAD